MIRFFKAIKNSVSVSNLIKYARNLRFARNSMHFGAVKIPTKPGHTPQKESENSWLDNDTSFLLDKIETIPPVKVAQILESRNDLQITEFLLKVPRVTFGNIFAELGSDFQIELYNSLGPCLFSKLFSAIPLPYRADFYESLDKKEQSNLLHYLSNDVKATIIKPIVQTESSIGSIMSTDFFTLYSDMDVQTAIEKLRKDTPSKKMIYYLYVVNHDMELMGFVSLKDLVVNPPDTKVADYLHKNYISAKINDDKEIVAQRIEEYDLLAIPILNDKNQLVGILRYDDAMDIIRSEETEDMERFMGIMSKSDEYEYLETSVLQHFTKRIVWIVGLFASSFLSEILIHNKESLLAKITTLALYIPMITAAGGNTGSQTATVVIRAISLGHVDIKQWLQIIFKETMVACLISLCLFCLAFLKVIILSYGTTGDIKLYDLAFAISLALSIQVITSAVIGAGLPILIKHFKGDPVVAASPAITTLVDITGMVIYFAVTATILL